LISEDPKVGGAKPVRRSLVEAQEAVSRVARGGGLPHAERAVLVAVEFTGERRKLTAAARLARTAAAVSAGTAFEAHDGDLAPKLAVDLDFDASLAEFEELARSAGAEVAATLIQRRPKPDPATLVGQGKLEEIEAVIASTGADLVLFDHDLTPSQLRNLEGKLPCRVIDRTQLILDILRGMRGPGRASCRWSWLSLSINCHDWRGAVRRCLSWAAVSERVGQVRRSWRRIAERSICVSIM
jgi:GTPase